MRYSKRRLDSSANERCREEVIADQVNKYNADIEKYNLQRDIINIKIDEYNELAKKPRQYLIPMPIPHHR